MTRKKILILFTLLILITIVIIAIPAFCATLSSKLSGRILLQVESNGEAWYVNPVDSKRYYLGRPDDAFNLMRSLGLGITNSDLQKISVDTSISCGTDSDKDGLCDNLEKALGTNANKADSDGDGYNDKAEVDGSYSPLGSGKLNIDSSLTQKLSGRILLQVESNGEAWYINPINKKRYYLGRPTDAFNLMRSLGLGITNADLGKIAEAAVGYSTSNDSPFGIHPAEGGNDYAYARDLGIKWNRGGMYLVWSWIDSEKNGKYNFTKAMLPATPNGTGGGAFNYDQERTKLNAADIEMTVNICPFRKGGDFGSDAEKNTYQKFVEKTVERYDGDEDSGCTLSFPDCYSKGDGQYPSNDLVFKFKVNPIKYWQLCNQVNDTCGSRDGCLNGNYATKYAEALRLTYESVKKADSSASVLIAGDSEKNLYPAVYKELNGKYIDIIDFHRFSMQSPEGSAWYNPKDDFDYLKMSLQSSGFDVNKLRFWITETGTYSGNPTDRVGKSGTSWQSEKKQAGDLLKVYVSALSYKIEKVFWAWSIVEGFQKDCGFFDYTGLVYDGCDCSNGKYACGSNIGYDLGKGVKKLSYYTYKKMTGVLGESDWNNIQTIQASDGVYIYKFTKSGKPVWVAWNDNSAEKQITISGITSSPVTVTETIPKYDSGKNVIDYNSAFNAESKTAQSGKITITLKDVPVFVY